MKEYQNNLGEFINALKNEVVPTGPPQETIDATLARLAEADSGADTAITGKQIRIAERIKAMKSSTKIAVAAVIIIAALIVVGVLTGPGEGPRQKIAKQPQDVPNIKEAIKAAKDTGLDLDFEPKPAAEKLEAELKKIEQMFASGDVEGLTAMLSKGQYESKIAAANFLAKIGDIKALATLERLSKNWEGNKTDNPFANAIAAIKSRVENQKTTPAADMKSKIELRKSEFTATGVLSGFVIDAKTGELISDVQISLQGPRYERTKTDTNGIYHFDKIREEGEYRIKIVSEKYVGITDYRKMPIISLHGNSNVVKHFELEPACMIDIEVVNEANEPIENVTVVVSSMTEEYGREIGQSQRTDKDGMATLGGIEPAEIEYLITAKQNKYIDYAPAGLWVKLNDTNTVEFGRIVMKKGVAVKGYAEYLDGVPAGGLKISAKPAWWHCGYSAPSYEIDPNGYFTLSHIEPGQYSIGVHIPQGGGYSVQTVLQTNLPLENELLMVTVPQKSPEALVAISGTITYVGEKKPDHIHISAYSRTRGHYSTYLNRYDGGGDNDLGTFTIDNLEPGTYRVTFSGSNIEHKTIENIKAPSSDLEVELSYQIKSRLEGVVLKAGTDEPVKQFKARIKSQRGRYGQNQRWREFPTSDGKFAIEVAGPGVYQVQVIAKGFAPGLSEEINAEKIEPVVIELSAGGTIKGKVANEAGEPISGAKVIPLSKAGGIDRWMAPKFVSEEGAVKTVSEEFVLKNLPEGSETIKVVHPNYSSAIVKDIEVIEGKTTEGIEVVLTKGGIVEGFVYDTEGKPQANVLLFFQEYNMYGGDEKAGRLASMVTDSNGFYRVKGLPEKMCYVRRSSQWSSLGVVRRTFFPVNGKTAKINLGGSPKISGQITIDGQPLSNTKVLMSDVHHPHSGCFMCYAMTGVDGKFAFWGPPSGTWAIYYETSNRRNKWVKVTTVDVDAKDIDLGTISPAPIEEKVLIEVKASDPNEPLDNMHITIQKGEKITGQQVCIATPVEGKKGLYVVQNLPSGKYTAMVYKRGYPMIREEFEIKESEEKVILTLRLPKGSATVTGVIKSESPMPLVMVSANEKVIGVLQPSENGSYKTERMPAGEYSISRWPLGDTEPPIKFTLAEGENKKLDIDASNWDVVQKSFLTVQVVSEDGLLLTRAETWLEGSTDDIEPTQKSSWGQMFITEPGEYTLHTTCLGYEEDVRNVSLEPRDMKNLQQPQPMIIKLKKK